MEKTGQWRFTPPTHVLAALDQALVEHAAEGGVAGRGARYARNCRILVDGLRALGFETLAAGRAPGADHRHRAHARRPALRLRDASTTRLSRRGYVIYPGKLTVADSFRIGCIGRLGEAEMRGVLQRSARSSPRWA